ncbi:arsenic resistance protein [Microbacterium indicum]|uniref:arsenic resistance protein n=1 Tax=Microbacterium indicum TaxID=358100 RepID=UPI000418F00B|nr:bile acid:sodium symporter [Microbacterium indicum]
MHGIAGWTERNQVALYVAGLAVGASVGLAVPAAARPAELAIQPVLALLLYVTFLGIPFGLVRRAFADWRFLATVGALDFVIVPLVVWPLSRIVAGDRALLVGVLFVLLAPCIDYVIVFAGLAGGDRARLLAASPVLMVAQVILLPVFLWAFAGTDVVGSLDLAPFGEAFGTLIALPLAAAVLTQLAAARWRLARRAAEALTGAMVPVMVATLAVVVASQIAGVGARLGSLALAALVFAAFAALMVPIGIATGRVARLGVAERRSVVFGGVTRNSLVVLPLVLALPREYDLSPLVVVTQTLVELVAMVVLVRIVPRLVPDGA